MPICIKDDRAVLFVHVPKTGGSSLEEMLADNGWDVSWRDVRAGPGTPNSHVLCSPQHLHAERLRQTFRLDTFDAVFMVVRDPFTRFRSEAGMRWLSHHGGTRAPLTEQAADDWADHALAAYREDPYVFDNHLRPQVEFRLPDAHVYRFEDGLESVVDALNADLGLGLSGEVPHALDRMQVSGFRTQDLPLSDALRRRLSEVYADDFEAFGYAPAVGPAAPASSPTG